MYVGHIYIEFERFRCLTLHLLILYIFEIYIISICIIIMLPLLESHLLTVFCYFLAKYRNTYHQVFLF